MLEYASEAAAAAGQAMPLKMCRDLLRVDVLGLPRPLSLFVVHLKSRTNRPWRRLAADQVRAAESRLVTQIVSAYRASEPAALLGLCGDFNDLVSSTALQPLQALGLCDPLGAALSRDGRNPSTYWPRRRMRIDHILLSPAAAALVVADSPCIHAHRMAQTASDHYPVSLRLDLARLADNTLG